MPVKRCTTEDGKPGWACGGLKCYPFTEGDAASEKRAKKRAIAQCVAIGENPAKSSLTAAVAAERITGVVGKAMDRAARLEPLMAEAILPTLDRAADEAARRFLKLTSAAPAADGPGWTTPASSELVDVDALVARVKKKLDPVMEETLRVVQDAIFSDLSGLTAAADEPTLSFDVKNPYTASVLDRTAAQVTSIADTTRTQVRKVMADAYDEGLSVPKTAERIRAKMKEANKGRATLIARTEFTGMVNGGSLAAAQTYEDVASAGLKKKWLTGSGAKHPRHETYSGLNGQLRPLKAAFDVGGHALQHPGDPNGPAHEVCNCRCAVTYVDATQAEAEEFVDDVSIGEGEPVPREIVMRIKEQGLDRSLDDLTPGTDVGRAIYRDAKDTEGLYRRGGVWTKERKLLHKRIIEAHFEGKVPSEELRAYYTAGGGASGKGGAVFNVDGELLTLDELKIRDDVVWIDPDRIKAMLPEYQALVDAGDFYAASGVHEESSAIAKAITDIAHDQGFSVIVDTTGSGSTFLGKMRASFEQGYQVQTTMFSTATNDAIARAVLRAERKGRYVAIEPLKRAHAGASRNLAEWRDASFLSEWRVYDNTGRGPVLVAEGGNGVTKVHDRKKWRAILAKAAELR